MRIAVYIDLKTGREVLAFIRALKSAGVPYHPAYTDFEQMPAVSIKVENEPERHIGGWYRNGQEVYWYGSTDISSMVSAIKGYNARFLPVRANSAAHFVSIARRMTSQGELV